MVSDVKYFLLNTKTHIPVATEMMVQYINIALDVARFLEETLQLEVFLQSHCDYFINADLTHCLFFGKEMFT